MKTALIAGVCLLALTFTITDALKKKQDLSCVPTPGSDLFNCVTAFGTGDADALCNDNCRTALTDFYSNCPGGDTLDQVLNQVCGDNGGNGGGNGGDGGNGGGNGGNGGDGDSSAATVGVTLFTIVSAVLVAVGN